MHEFNRVLKSDDVNRLVFVDLVQQGGQRGGFAGTGCTSHQNQPRLFLRRHLENIRQLQVREGRNNRVQLAQNNRVVASLGKNVDAEPGDVGEGIGSIAGPVFQQILGQAL